MQKHPLFLLRRICGIIPQPGKGDLKMGNVRFTGRMWRRQLKIDSLRQRSAFSAIGIVIYETMYWPEQLEGKKRKRRRRE